jgi:hypothetical protein
MAGEPLPEPISRRLSSPPGITFAAIKGSMINLFSNESVSTLEVKLTVEFQRAKRAR